MKQKIWIWSVCIVLIGAIGLWALSNGSGSSAVVDTESRPNEPDTSHSEVVTIPDINAIESPSESDEKPAISEQASGQDAPDTVPDMTQATDATLSEPPVLQPEKETTDVEVPITEPTPANEPVKPPKPTPQATDQPPSPDTPPTYDATETQPNKPQNEPRSGDKNESGQVYFPGFGWIEPSGPSQGSISESDGDWDKQVGIMD